jgi:hypothetical protein
VDSNATTCKSRDILSSRLRVFLLYWLPAIAIVVAGAHAISRGWRTVVWTVALGTMGVACIVNALRCGRVHCYLTGPFFLLMALIALSYGSRHVASRRKRLEPARPNSPDRHHCSLVPARNVSGKISAPKLTANWFTQSQSTTANIRDVGNRYLNGITEGLPVIHAQSRDAPLRNEHSAISELV